MMIWYHHLPHTGKKHPSLQDLKLAETGDSETWCRAWPDGIPPFSTYRYYVRSEEQPIIRDKYLSIKPKVEELLSWWASEVAPSVRQSNGEASFPCRDCQYQLDDTCRWCKKYNLGKICYFLVKDE